jgi:hypothetical protein
MEVVKSFQFSKEDINAIKRVYAIITKMGNEMDSLGSQSEIELNGYRYTVNDMCGEIWEFFNNFSDQVILNKEIPVNTNC